MEDRPPRVEWPRGLEEGQERDVWQYVNVDSIVLPKFSCRATSLSVGGHSRG
jgi:hypothetical protein